MINFKCDCGEVITVKDEAADTYVYCTKSDCIIISKVPVPVKQEPTELDLSLPENNDLIGKQKDDVPWFEDPDNKESLIP